MQLHTGPYLFGLPLWCANTPQLFIPLQLLGSFPRGLLRRASCMHFSRCLQRAGARILVCVNGSWSCWRPHRLFGVLMALPSCPPAHRGRAHKRPQLHTPTHFHEGEKAVGFSVVCFEDPQLKAEDSVGVSWEIRAAGPKNPSEG